MKSMGPLPAWAFVSMLLSLATLDAGETRLWIFPAGAELEAGLVKSDLASATLVDKAGKEHRYKIGDLGIGDREFMVEQAGADPQILALGEMAVPEKQMPSPVKSFETLKDQKAVFGEATLSLFKTEHFLFAWDGKVKPVALGVILERLWFGLAVQHTDFRKNWGDRRMMVMVPGRKNHLLIGRWFFRGMVDAGQRDEAGRMAQDWDTPGLKDGFRISADMAAGWQVKEETFYLTSFVLSPLDCYENSLLVHQLSERLFRHLTGSVDGPGSYAFFTGCAFHEEMQITGKIVASVKKYYDSDNYSSKTETLGTGFRGDWATELRGLVQKGGVRLDLTAVVPMEYGQATAENLALMESWIAFMQSTNPRLVRFDRLVRQIAADHKVPSAEEIVKIYGFDSVAAFNESWTQFILDRGRK